MNSSIPKKNKHTDGAIKQSPRLMYRPSLESLFCLSFSPSTALGTGTLLFLLALLRWDPRQEIKCKARPRTKQWSKSCPGQTILPLSGHAGTGLHILPVPCVLHVYAPCVLHPDVPVDSTIVLLIMMLRLQSHCRGTARAGTTRSCKLTPGAQCNPNQLSCIS